MMIGCKFTKWGVNAILNIEKEKITLDNKEVVSLKIKIAKIEDFKLKKEIKK